MEIKREKGLTRVGNKKGQLRYLNKRVKKKEKVLPCRLVPAFSPYYYFLLGFTSNSLQLNLAPVGKDQSEHLK